MKNDLIKVSIGIQARSTSERFPNKIMADICGKPMLEWVVDSAIESSLYLNRPTTSINLRVNVFLLMPYNDAAIPYFTKKTQIIEGDEYDVLSRYLRLAEQTEADYIVRLTGDTPLIPGAIISKAVNTACHNKLDYCSNVDERLRVSFDGSDVEVVSRRLLNYIGENATDKRDREHVTTFYRNNQMKLPYRSGHIIGYVNLKNLKLSVDTEEDLEAVREQKRDILNAIYIAQQLSGRHSVYRF